MRSARGTRFLREISSKNKFTFELSYITDFYLSLGFGFN